MKLKMRISFLSDLQNRVSVSAKEIFAATLLLAATIVFWKIYVINRLVLPGPDIYTTDMYSQFYPKFIYGNKILNSGHVPLWEPNEFCGMPFLATLQAEVFYPFKYIIFSLFAPAAAIRVFIAFHIFIIGLLSYIFFRVVSLSRTSSFIASLVWAFSAPLAFESLFHPARLASISWFPFSLICLHMLLTKRKLLWSLLLAIGVSLQFLAGYPPIILSSITLLFVYYVFQTWVFRPKSTKWDLYKTHYLLIFSAVLFAALIALQFLPFYEFLKQSQRSTGATTIWQLPIHYLMPLSRLFSGAEEIQERRTPLFMGCTSFLLLLYGVILSKRKIRMFFATACIFTVVMSLGAATPVSPLLHRFPPFKYDRYPIMWYYYYFFFVAGLVGLGVDYLKDDCSIFGNLVKGRWLTVWRRDNIAFLILLAFVAVFSFLELQLIEIISIALTGLVIFSLILAQNKYMKELLAILLLLIMVLVYASQIALQGEYVQLPRTDVSELSTPTLSPLIDSLFKQNRFYRVYSGELLWQAKYLFSGIDMVNGYEGSLLPGRMVRIIGFYAYGYKFAGQDWERFVNNPTFLNLMGARLIFVPLSKIALFQQHKESYEVLNAPGHEGIVLNKHALPRCFLVHKADVSKNEEEAFAKLRDNQVDPWNAVVLEESLPADVRLMQPHEREDSPRIVTYKPEEILVEASPRSSAFLVLNDTYYSGWKAFDNGKEAHIYRANYLFRAIYLSPGKHTVRFVYAPLSFKWGLGISIVGLLVVVVFFVCLAVTFSRSQRKKRTAAP